MLFCLGGRLVWDLRVGKYLPSTGELRFLRPSGNGSAQPENAGEEIGWVSRAFLVLVFQIPVPMTQGGAVDGREVASEICIIGTLYRNEGFFGRLLWRNFVSVLALLGPWPETPLAGEVLEDLGVPDVLGSCVKGWW